MAEQGSSSQAEKVKLPNWTVPEKKVLVEYIAAHYKEMVGSYEEASGNQADRRAALWDEAVEL